MFETTHIHQQGLPPLSAREIDLAYFDENAAYSAQMEDMERVHSAVQNHNSWKNPICDADASALKRRDIEPTTASSSLAPAAFARVHAKGTSSVSLEPVTTERSSEEELEELENMIRMIQSTPSSAPTLDKKPAVRSAQAALMQAYATIRPLISNLRFLESERMHKKMVEIEESVQNETWWQSLMGTTNGVGFGLQAAVMIAGISVGGDMGQIATSFAGYMNTAITGATNLEQSYMIEPAHKKSVYQQTIAMEKEKQRSMGELEKEMKQMVLQLLQLRAEASRRAASAAGG